MAVHPYNIICISQVHDHCFGCIKFQQPFLRPFLNANKSCCNCTALSWLTIGQKILTSSANNNAGDFITLTMSSRIGVDTHTEPCGTPHKTLLVIDFTPLTTTVCFLHDKNDLIHKRVYHIL